jgi:hypothetical protein
MGHRVRLLLASLCVASSLALVALGGSDPTRRVFPLNPEIWQTHGNHGTHFGYGCHIP